MRFLKKKTPQTIENQQKNEKYRVIETFYSVKADGVPELNIEIARRSPKFKKSVDDLFGRKSTLLVKE